VSLKLNLGCGIDKREGYINLDNCENVYPDVLHDLDLFPWPFQEGMFEEIVAADIFEHVLYPIKFMNECWRILELSGKLLIRTSYFDSEQSFCDPTHRRFLTINSFDFFDTRTELGARYWWYTKYKWRIIQKALGVNSNETYFVLEKDLEYIR